MISRHERDFSLYIHIPFCVSKCAYCDFLSFSDFSCMNEYFCALFNEIEQKSSQYKRIVNNIYVGGGTPSVAIKYLPKLFDSIYGHFQVAKDAEISIECNPESVTEEFVDVAKKCGVNRVSVGVQSLDDNVLKTLSRAHDSDTANRALTMICDAFNNVNADIMIGVPSENVENVARTINSIISYPLKHLSVYSLILERGTPLAKSVKNGLILPTEDETVNRYDEISDLLAKNGYFRYEISNFCKDNAVCNYNYSVWNYASYLGLGLGASSFVRNEKAFSAHRCKGYTHLDKYIAQYSSCAHAQARQLLIRTREGKSEYIMLGLRLAEGLDVASYNNIFAADFFAEYGEKLSKIAKYLNITPNNVAIKPEYVYISNSIICEII